MSASSESFTLTFPWQVAKQMPTIASELNTRMHELLERNTEGALSFIERRELETLIHMAEFAQILSMASTRPLNGP